MFEYAKGVFKKLFGKNNTSTIEKYEITEKKYLEKTIRKFLVSSTRNKMMDGDRYYIGNHDILQRKRTVIGSDGSLETIDNLPNNKIVDNQYKKMVDQKTNYLFGLPFFVQCDDEEYKNILDSIFNKRFLRLLKVISLDSLNCGIGFLYVYYNYFGEFKYKRFNPIEIIPIWEDNDHTELKKAIRIYEDVVIVNNKEKVVQKVEVYEKNGIYYFEFDKGALKPIEPFHKDYITIDDRGYNWNKIPIIPFKYNNKEIPLINNIKSLQDGLNLIKSNFQNQMEEDTRNTILVLVNYDGQNLGEFRKNLATYGAVKVKTVDGSGGDLKTLQVEVNAENYKVIIDMFKKAIVENALGYDTKNESVLGNPNQMNILSMYNDIDLDAKGMETEYSASFEELIWFINIHLYNSGLGDFENVKVDINFNRDMIMNESDIIKNIQSSVGVLSNKTLIENHPFVKDVNVELQRIKEEVSEEMEPYKYTYLEKNKNEDDLDE